LRLYVALFFAALLAPLLKAQAQSPALPGNPVTLQNAPQRDTTDRRSKADWHDEPVQIHATKAFSAQPWYPDSTVHNFQRRPFLGIWKRDLGNLGTAVRSQLFTPDNLGLTGPTLGYHVYDAYRINPDSLLYFNTTRPYTLFSYQLASKLEQSLRLQHTQNIRPNWNIFAQYQKISSQGYYKLQRSNHDNAAVSTNYRSNDQHYVLYAGVVYNREQSDENGGILGDSLLNKKDVYSDPMTIPVAFDNPAYYVATSQGQRSPVTNMMRDISVVLRHQYNVGKYDTTYNADSTQMNVQLRPRFGVHHELRGGGQFLRSKNVAPDSLLYVPFFQRDFATADSVYMQQHWNWLDNAVSLNGFIGPTDQPLEISAGAGLRLDAFYTDYAAEDRDERNFVNTYLTGSIRKQALTPQAWGYEANLKFFVAGQSIGNYVAQGELSKRFDEYRVRLGGTQQLTEAPYAYTLFRNQYFEQRADLKNESITAFWGEISQDKLGLSAGVKSYLIGNYIYLKDSLEGVSNGKMQFSQYGSVFNLNQLTFRAVFHFGPLYIDNNIALQQVTGDAPVSVPTLLGRHSISLERYLFGRALSMAAGLEVRYHTNYHAEGYAPFYNRFYYQNDYLSSNFPEGTLFFNFRIKRFRAYLMADQFQTLFWRNTVIHPNYPSQPMMLRLGFDWVMVN
jgi:hypothetical protein